MTETDRAALEALLAEKPKRKPSPLDTLLMLGCITIIVITAIVAGVKWGYGVNLFHVLNDIRAAQQPAAAVQAAQEAASGAAARIRTVVQQYAPPAAQEAAEPALRQPKDVEWDGKSIKTGRPVVEAAPKAAPVEEPKIGKEIPTPAPLVAQPVRPGPGKVESGKQERMGKETK